MTNMEVFGSTFGYGPDDPIPGLIIGILIFISYFAILRLNWELFKYCRRRMHRCRVNAQRKKKNMFLTTDYGKKRYMVEQVNQIIKETSGYDPGYYVAGGEGNPRIYDRNECPRKSVKDNTPSEVLMNLAQVMKEDYLKDSNLSVTTDRLGSYLPLSKN